MLVYQPEAVQGGDEAFDKLSLREGCSSANRPPICRDHWYGQAVKGYDRAGEYSAVIGIQGPAPYPLPDLHPKHRIMRHHLDQRS